MFWFVFKDIVGLSGFYLRPGFLSNVTLTVHSTKYHPSGYNEVTYKSDHYSHLMEMMKEFYKLHKSMGMKELVPHFFKDNQYITNGAVMYEIFLMEQNGMSFPDSGLCEFNCKCVDLDQCDFLDPTDDVKGE